MRPPASLAGLTLSSASISHVACMERTTSDCPSACASVIDSRINARDPAEYFFDFFGKTA